MFLRVRAAAISRGLPLYSPQNFSPPQKNSRKLTLSYGVRMKSRRSWAEHRLHFTSSPYKSIVNNTRRDREISRETDTDDLQNRLISRVFFLLINANMPPTIYCVLKSIHDNFQLCATKLGRETLRSKGIYPALRELDKAQQVVDKNEQEKQGREILLEKMKKESLILQMTSRKCKRLGFWAEKRSTPCTPWSASSSDTNPKWTSTRTSTRSEASAEDFFARETLLSLIFSHIFFCCCWTSKWSIFVE